jgi:hypothetical protein
VNKPFSIAAIAAATFVCNSAQAAKLPGYELKGFPITRPQLAVIGAVDVQEQSPAPTLMFAGMPASPSQVAILTPRRNMTSTTALAKPVTMEMVSK